MKTHAIKIESHGGPEVLSYREINLESLNDHDVLVRHHAIGVNFVDTYYRSGLYSIPLPSGIGSEAAGVIEAVGKKVLGFKPGDRVAYATGPQGSYAVRRIIESKFLVKIPSEISFEAAASSLLKGLTVHYLFRKIHTIRKNEKFVFHAAAGGVGLIACQWARHLGAKLIGTVSSDEKAEAARKAGAWEVINYVSDNVPQKVLELTEGDKVPVVYDGIGKSTWEISLDCLSPRGLMVSFGNASGPVTGVNLAILSQKGSLFVTRPILAHYVSTPEELTAAADELFSLMRAGHIKSESPERYPLSDASAAHLELMNRKRTGAIVLIP